MVFAGRVRRLKRYWMDFTNMNAEFTSQPNLGVHWNVVNQSAEMSPTKMVRNEELLVDS